MLKTEGSGPPTVRRTGETGEARRTVLSVEGHQKRPSMSALPLAMEKGASSKEAAVRSAGPASHRLAPQVIGLCACRKEVRLGTAAVEGRVAEAAVASQRRGPVSASPCETNLP
ncbi:MAG: hypothetical protein ACJAYU_005390 [Bradymonadia bacterium]|jgi:hypothetical protein